MDSLLFAWSSVSGSPAAYAAGLLMLCYKPLCLNHASTPGFGLVIEDRRGVQRGIASIASIKILYYDCTPLFFAAAIVNFLQIAALIKSIVTDERHAAWNSNAGQVAAETERSDIDSGNTIRNSDVGESAAVSERMTTNFDNAIGDGDVGEIGAIIECLTLD